MRKKEAVSITCPIINSQEDDNSIMVKTTSSYYTSVAQESEKGIYNGEDNSTPAS